MGCCQGRQDPEETEFKLLTGNYIKEKGLDNCTSEQLKIEFSGLSSLVGPEEYFEFMKRIKCSLPFELFQNQGKAQKNQILAVLCLLSTSENREKTEFVRWFCGNDNRKLMECLEFRNYFLHWLIPKELQAQKKVSSQKCTKYQERKKLQTGREIVLTYNSFSSFKPGSLNFN